MDVDNPQSYGLIEVNISDNNVVAGILGGP